MDEFSEESAAEIADPSTEITYDEQRYPARPRRLRPRDQFRGGTLRRFATDPRSANGTNPAYVEWLVRQSMLKDADVLSRHLSGQPSMWRNPYARPDARRAIGTSDVWFTAYPISLITPPGVSFLQALGEDRLWEAFERIGINGIHTGPVKRAGGITGWQQTPSVDGHFDRISTQIDPAFGDEEAFRRLCDVADQHHGSVIDDIVPGHTGKGADFRLAEMAYKDYPGIYHMVEIPAEDWHLLPEVPEGRDAVNLDPATEQKLSEHGYIIGELQRVIFYTPGVKETNWSATGPVVGTDGVQRRWVYLHYFKQGQPSINWLDPTFAGMRLVIGDALHSLGDLGTSALRLDANGFLGVEKSAEGLPAWSEGHPLSHAANHIIAGMVRKVGGFTFQELNLTMEDIRDTGAVGADLSYDFVSRPAYHHALATGQTEFLRLTLTTALEVGVEPVQLVHGMQNHDELTYELVHWATTHRDDTYFFRHREVTGGQLAEEIRADLTEKLVGTGDYNRVFTQNGIACTTASIIAASQGFARLEDITEEDVPLIRDAHLLLAKYNAWQPGVFALSAWDLMGILTLPADDVRELIESGDTRWISRGAHDLLDTSPDATRSQAGMLRGRSLYGSLPAQFEQPDSFAAGLTSVLDIRREHSIATATQLDIPPVAHQSMLVLVHRLDDGDRTKEDAPIQVTVLNFSGETIEGTVHSEALVPQRNVVDAATGQVVAHVDDLQSFGVHLAPYAGLFLILDGQVEGGPAAAGGEPGE
ncbi:maltose alpha-D-glucosyltransferase [Naasia sp. SYSU D00057]|uniref:maltose alpha-D-glucosyltransferase n=1 Tax=Naasia sp. SYSU D00057 TaxID=2817380 RepID=UPI001B3070F4|nr:maltose alpha-D-glucosyltransferase [Naasia sp. SYSU D00057]